MANQEIVVPDIGDFSDVEIIEVLVSPGDKVNVDDPLITVESDKASMDIPSSAAGTVVELKVSVGDKISQGTSVIILDPSSGDQVDSGDPDSSESDSAVTSVTANSVAVNEDAANNDPLNSDRPNSNSAPAATLPKDTSPLALSISEPVNEVMSHRTIDKNAVYASPSVRRLARERNIDLTQISGTGPKGRITKEDLDSPTPKASSGATSQPAAGVMSAIPSIPGVDFSQFGEIEVKPLTRIQKISGPHLHRAWLNVPMVTHHDEADITDLEEFRNSLKAEAEKKGIRVTGLVFMMKALAANLKAFPSFNSSLSEDGTSLILKKYINIGIAVDTPNGLMVPVFRDVDKKSIYELSEELGEISKKARDSKLSPTDLQGGCMSISSLGGIGGTAFTPLVNAPEVAILGLTRSKMQPVWNGNEFIPRLMQPIDLTYDHRVIDGANAARFVAHLCKNLSDLKRLLL